jgi:tryptophan 2,3-dioxygenase
LLSSFEKRYHSEFIDFTQEYNTINLYAKFKGLPKEVKQDPDLLKAMRHFDYTVNITWVMAHYNAARYYIGGGENQEAVEATGGSDWTKYMLPKYQKRVFFPEVWSDQELADWGKNV